MGVKIRSASLKLFCIVLCWALLLAPCAYLIYEEFNDTAALLGEADSTPVINCPTLPVGSVAVDIPENSDDDLPKQDLYENADLVISVPADKHVMSVGPLDIGVAAGQAPDLFKPPVVVKPGLDNTVESEVEQDSSAIEEEPEEDDSSEADTNNSISGSAGFYGTYALLTQPNGSNFIYYDQTWPAYANHPYGANTIGGYGCGPTSMAMVVSNLTGTVVTPDKMGDWAYNNGYFINYRGTAYGLFPAASAAYGINCTTASIYDKEAVVSALKAGKLVLTIVGPGDFTVGRHFLLIRGITEDGKLLLGDSGKYENSLQPWDYYRVINQVSGGQCWIFG